RRGALPAGGRLMRRVIVWSALTVAVVVAGWSCFEHGASPDQDRQVVGLITAVALGLVVPSIVGGWRRPDDRRPGRVVAAALALTIGDFRLLEPSWAATLGAAAWYLTPALILTALLTSGRRSSLPRGLTLAVPGVLTVGLLLTSGPRTTQYVTA